MERVRLAVAVKLSSLSTTKERMFATKKFILKTLGQPRAPARWSGAGHNVAGRFLALSLSRMSIS